MKFKTSYYFILFLLSLVLINQAYAFENFERVLARCDDWVLVEKLVDVSIYGSQHNYIKYEIKSRVDENVQMMAQIFHDSEDIYFVSISKESPRVEIHKQGQVYTYRLNSGELRPCAN